MPSNKKLRNQLEALFDQPTETAASAPAPASATAWSWETDARGTFTFCSADVEAVLGYTPAEMLGKTFANLIVPASTKAVQALSDPAQDLKQLFSKARPVLDVWLPVQHRDKRSLTIILNARPIVDDKEKLLGYRGIGTLAQPTPAAPPAPELPSTPPVPSTPEKKPRPARKTSASLVMPSPATGTRSLTPLSVSRPATPPAVLGYLDTPTGARPLPDNAEIPAEPAHTLRLPIQLQDQSLGILKFFDESGQHVWLEDDIALAQAVADQLALALENMRLFNETREYLQKQTLLYEVTRAAATTANVTEAMQGAAQALAQVLPESNVAIFLLDADSHALHVRAAVGFPPQVAESLHIPVGQGITGWVAQHNQPQLVADVQADQRYVPTLPGINSEIAVPLALGERIIGVLNAESLRPNAFDESDVQLLSTLAGTLSAIIVNNNLLEQIEQERQRLSLLYEVLRSLSQNLNLNSALNTALEFAPRLGAQHGYVVLVGQTLDHAAFVSTIPELKDLPAPDRVRMAETITQQGLERWVLEHQRAAVVSDTHTDERWYPGAPSVRSVIAVPMLIPQSGRRGVLAYTHPAPDAFNAEQLPLMESITAQVVVAIENALLLSQVRAQQYNSNRLAEATQAVSSILNEATLLNTLAQQLFDSFIPNAVLIWHWDEVTAVFSPRAVINNPDADMALNALPADGERIPAQLRPDLLEVIQTRQLRVQPVDPAHPLQESMAVPLIYGGEVEGVAEVIHTGVTFGLTEVDKQLAQSILIASASALQTARLYEEQRQTAERLAEVDRLKSQFLANMSHELRTPLNSIIGFSRVILKGIDGPLTELQMQDLTSINNAGQHLLGLINSVLDMAKIEAGKLELVLDEIEAADTIQNAITTSASLIKDKPLTLQADIEPNLPTLRADNLRFRQVLFNLLSNAVKFTDKGTITVRARAVESSGPPPASARGGQKAGGVHRPQPGRFVEISVHDEGHGIAETDLAKLFEAFSQVDASATRKTGGTGLGLSICRQLVELHGGRIWVTSWPGEGSTFTFTLPAFKQPAPASSASTPTINPASIPVASPLPPAAPVAPPPPRLPELPRPQAAVVMAVDDDPGVLNLYRRYLEPHGYRVVGVQRSQEAATRALEIKPDVILLDVLMPDKDGWQVLAELRQAEDTRATPIILCTLIGDVNRGQDLGATDHLTKPILESDLMRALGKLRLRQPQNGK